MGATTNGKFSCQICHKIKRQRELVPADLVRDAIVEHIRKKIGSWDATGYICFDDLNVFRSSHIQDLLIAERGELSEVELNVIDSLRETDVLAADVNRQFEGQKTLGETVSDRVASFGGSWKFIIGFGVVMAIWMLVNSRNSATFDPFPFIFLNLILSCLAAIQAPIIMMSQNRQESKDRLRSEHDYRVNLKAELEIRNLTTKVDLLISHQWQHLLEIQQIQTDMMNELLKSMGKPK